MVHYGYTVSVFGTLAVYFCLWLIGVVVLVWFVESVADRNELTALVIRLFVLLSLMKEAKSRAGIALPLCHRHKQTQFARSYFDSFIQSNTAFNNA